MSLFDLDLPAGFAWIRVGDAYEVTKKPRGLDISSVAAVPFATMEAMPQGGAYAPDYEFRPSHAIRTGTYFERGDVLVAKITPSFENGKQALVTELPAPFGFATTEVIPLRPRHNGQERRFLFFYLLHPDVRHHVAERMEGSTGRQRVPTEVLLDLPYPSLPPEDQVIVAESLESLLRLKSVEDQSIVTTQALKRAAMHTLFTRGLRGEAQKETEIGHVPESWEIIRVEEHAKVISKGSSPKWQGFDYVKDGILFVRSQNVGNGVMEWQDKTFLPPAWNEQERRSVLQSGDVLVNLVGASIGRSAVGGPEIEGANCNQAVCFVRLVQNEVIPGFLNGFLLTPQGQAQIHGKKKDIARANLSLQDVRNVLMPKPPINEQRDTVAVLDAVDRKIDLHRRKCAVLEELFKALLHKLMIGEIPVGELDIAALSDGIASGMITPQGIGEQG